MPLITVNDFALLKGEIRMPRCGVFNGDLVIDTPNDISGPVTLKSEDGKFTLKGVAYREGPFIQRTSMRFVGGNNGLDKLVPPKAFNGYTVRSILSDTLTACGETLSSTTDPTLLSIFLSKWVRLAQTGKDVIRELLDIANGEAWRILPDGTFFATMNETYPPVNANTDFELINWERSEGWALIGCQQPFALPGQTITLNDGTDFTYQKQISYLVHNIDPETVRTTLYFEDL